MDYKELSRVIRELSEIYGLADEVASQLMLAASTSIIDLLARAEAAEQDRDRLLEDMKPNCLMCDSMHENGNCTEVGGFCTAVPAAHCPLIPRLLDKLEKAEARAHKAEQELRNYKMTRLYDMPPMGGFHD